MSDATEDTEPTPCPHCEGRGYIGSNYQYCGPCYGSGRKDAPSPHNKRKADIAWARRVSKIASREND